MIYTASITTAANTPEGSNTDVILQTTSGLVWMFDIDFPPGCCGLLHVQLFDGSYQVLPASVGDSLHGDSVSMRFDDLYLKQAAPFEFRIRTWNLDDTWPHTIQLRLGMASSRAEMSRYMPALSFEDFEKMLAESIAQQEAIRQLQLEAALSNLMQ